MSLSCRCCKKGLPVQDRKVCPECGHIFQGNGWDGIDAHWRAKHESHLSYRDFWNSLCLSYRGAKAVTATVAL